MAILGNYKTNYDTETTTANNSMGFDPSAIQSCSFPVMAGLKNEKINQKIKIRPFPKYIDKYNKIELHWGQNPLKCLLLLFLYQNCFYSCLRLPLIKLIDI